MQVEIGQKQKVKYREIKEYGINNLENDIYYNWIQLGKITEIYFLSGETIEYFLNKLSMLGIEIPEIRDAKLFHISDIFAVYKIKNVYIFVTIVADSLDMPFLDVKIKLRIYYY